MEENNEYISPEAFSSLSPTEQNWLMREYVTELSAEERKILKILIENQARD